MLYYYKGLVAVPPLQMVDDILGIKKCSSQSVQLNTTVNAFIEHEKLELSEKKCHKVHIGKFDRNCPDLEVHGKRMHEASSEKYLGDIFNKSGNNKQNIASRVAKGYSRVNMILALLDEAPLGWAKIKAGIRLRKAMLINAILFISESWQDVKEDDVKDLERADEALLRGLVHGHAKVAIPALYLHLGQEPIRFILASRRILYLHTILNREDKEITKRTYDAQKQDPINGDFCLLVQKDLKMIGLNLTDNEIKKLSKGQLKSKLKKTVKEAALKHLIQEVEHKNLSKMKHHKYDKLIPMTFLTYPTFSRDQASLLFALRTRTVRGVRSDFGNMYSSKVCPLLGECTHDDTLSEMLSCPVLRQKAPDLLEPVTVQYSDVFSADLEQQKKVTLVYARLLEIREEIISPPVA